MFILNNLAEQFYKNVMENVKKNLYGKKSYDILVKHKYTILFTILSVLNVLLLVIKLMIWVS